MDEDVADGQLINVCGKDPSSLLAETVQSGVKTALDRLLMSDVSTLNGFNNSI